MKKTILSVLFASLAGYVFATAVRIDDGKVTFSAAQVNGVDSFTAKEKKSLEDTFKALPSSAAVAVDVEIQTPTADEVNLSTCVGKFEGYSDWRNCQTKAGIKAKIVQMRYRNLGFPDTPEIDWLVSYYQKLQD